jgi:putative transport protein
MIELLRDNPLLLLFLVAAIGYPLGRITIQGSSLGVAAVLFVGLAFGSLHPDLKLPEVVYQLGLIIFVYTIGLSSGPGFFAALRRKGLRDNLLIIGAIVLAMALTGVAAVGLGLSAPLAAGMLAGSLTNTPALAGAIEQLKSNAPPNLEQLLGEPVVGYSVTYPMGVCGAILMIALAQRIWKVDYAAERRAMSGRGTPHRRLANQTIRITRPDAAGETTEELIRRNGWDVIIGRVKREGQLTLANGQTRLAPGDLVSVVGAPDELARVTTYLGAPADEHLEHERSELDYRRIFVSRHSVAGRRLRDLHLPQRFGAVVTRVRRGDVELLPHGDTVIEPGDRVRVVAPRSQMDAVTSFFGDSYRTLSEIDVLTFSLGIALGVLLGLVPFPLPGGVTLRLGFAGGPLLVALALGALERTGPLVWSMPYSANLTLRQLGLVLFLAGVGTRSGYVFASTLTQGGGLAIFVVGALVTCIAALGVLWVGYRLLKIPMSLLIGMVAGLQTQPAVLGFALEQAESDLPSIGYATVYPVAMITKIVLVQVLLLLL